MSAATASVPADSGNNDPHDSSAPFMQSSGGGSGGEGPNPFQTPSLYVGDLPNDVNEGLLFEIFSAVGPVASIRVCRDAVTRRSLGYAYVNFHQLADAERALDTMNFSEIKGKPCRIMWSQRDPSLRRSGVGNIFVKNLHESIDNKQLYDTFSLFGNILSCKVVTDRETGLSKGYGYVHYDTAEAANAAIEKLDGMLIDGQEVQVGHFMRRPDRPDVNSWTNCYIKNVPFEWDDARLRQEFERFGEIVSASVARGTRKATPAGLLLKRAQKAKEGENDDEDKEDDELAKQIEQEEDDERLENADKQQEGNQTLGYGFVNFEEHEAAAEAVEELNGKEYPTVLDGEEIKVLLYVGRAQKKAERERELRAKFEAEKMDRIAKFQGVNLYVKNLDDSVSDDALREEFAPMGTITSARVMKDMKDGRSRGFGFVCFSSPEEATRAVNEMNGKLIANKPIFVALAQRREVRRAQLEAQHASRGGPGMPGQPGMMRAPMGHMGYPGMPMYMQGRPGPGVGMQPAYPMMPQQMMGPGGRGMPPGGRGGYPQMMGQQGRGGYPMPYGGMPQPGRGGRGGPMQGPPGRGGGRGGGRGMPMPGQQQGGIKFSQQVRNFGPMPGGPPQQVQGMPLPHEGALTASALASASPEMQKNMIGERLYPLIHQSQPDLAGKITGMLLEMDNSELLHLLESPDALNSKIQEALQVLEAHQAQESS